MDVERVGEGQRVGGPRRGWAVPAVAVVGLLLGLALAGRAGAPPSPAASPEPTGAAVTPPADLPPAGGNRPPDPIASATLSPPPLAVLVLPPFEFLERGEFEMAPDQWVDHYADGIPASINRVPVYRLSAAMHLAGGAPGGLRESVLVGGWYAGPGDIMPGCDGASWPEKCPRAKLADDPIRLSHGLAVDIDGLLDEGGGPRVIRGAVQVGCAPGPGGPAIPICWGWIVADEVVWAGDQYTDAAPVSVMPVVSAIADTVADFNPRPFHAYGSCTLDLPRQSYYSPTGQVKFLLVYASTTERLSREPELQERVFGAASECVVPQMDAPARWISYENVSVGLRDASRRTIRSLRDLLEQLAQ